MQFAACYNGQVFHLILKPPVSNSKVSASSKYTVKKIPIEIIKLIMDQVNQMFESLMHEQGPGMDTW